MNQRIALVGAGFMAQTHADAWATLRDSHRVSIAWVVSPSERGRWLADRIGAHWTSEIDDVYRDSSVSALDICSPTLTHGRLFVQAVQAGLHVLVEKPLALGIEGLRAIGAAWAARRDGQIAMVGHVARFMGGYRTIRARVDAGAIGLPTSLLTTRYNAPPDWGAWILDEQQSGGAIVDLLVHDFDLANSILGVPRRVRASRYRDGIYEAHVNYRDSAATITGGFGMPVGVPLTSSFFVAGTRGTLRHASSAGIGSGSGDEVVEAVSASGFRTLAVKRSDPFAAQLGYFSDCMRNGTEPTVGTIPDSIRSTTLALAARDSVASGESVDLEAYGVERGNP